MKASTRNRLARLAEDLQSSQRLLTNARGAPADDVVDRLKVLRRTLNDSLRELDLVIKDETE